MDSDKAHKLIERKSNVWNESVAAAINNGGNIDGLAFEGNKTFVSSLISYFESVGNYEACIMLFDKFKDLV